MKIVAPLLIFIAGFCMFSCKVQQKIPNYLQQITDTTGKGVVQIPQLRIQKNDVLSITIFSSSTDTRIDAMYNLPVTNTAAVGSSGNSTGFLVNAKGDIEYPKLGVIHVEGLTKEELAEQIKKKLTEPVKLLENPSVLIRYLNLKVTVIGEVNTQGIVNIPGERITILEAVGLAGGITDYGKKNAVKILRESDGDRQVGYVDLSDKNLFASPYYNLQQNDVVVVEPIPRKARRADNDYVFQRVSFGLSIITAMALVYSFLR